MFTPRAYAAMAVAGLLLVLSGALWSSHRTVVTLRGKLAAAESATRNCTDAARKSAQIAADQAQACGVEGSSAFTRGVAVGKAICAARR